MEKMSPKKTYFFRHIFSLFFQTKRRLFNIFDQSPLKELFSVCLENNVGVIARVPFDEGALCGKINPETRFAKKDWRNRYFAGDRKRQVFDRVARLKELLGAGEGCGFAIGYYPQYRSISFQSHRM